MFRKFNSIAHSDKYGYAYDSQAWDARAPLESHFRMFDTYGDGLTAHSPDWSVQVEFLADYLFSLAQAMLTDAELSNELYFTIWRRPDEKRIAWASTVVYRKPKDGEYAKPRYFSAKEMKVSANSAKQYDKRYEEVREVHDGTANSIFRILTPEYANGFGRYVVAEVVRDYLLAHDGYMQLAAEFLQWFKDDPEQREKSRQLRDAYEACRYITEAHRLRSAAESGVENYKRRAIKPAPTPEPEPAKEPEAVTEAAEKKVVA